MFKIRNPAVAGKLYENDRDSLMKQIESCFGHKLGPGGMKKQKAIGGIVPHNSVISSGPIAAWLYSKLEKSNYVIVGASQVPMQTKFALMKEGLWKTPLGEIAIDRVMADALLDSSRLIEYDAVPHQTEYSIEVQLPFLQYRFGDDFKIVPILTFGQFADDNFLDSCTEVGNAIAKAAKVTGGGWQVIATAQFNNTKPKVASELTKAIAKLDAKKFFNKIKETKASVSGFGSIAVAIAATKKLGAKKGKLLRYAVASKVHPEIDSDAGYASIIIY